MADPAIDRVRSVARRPLPPHPKLVHTQADLRTDTARRALSGVDVLWHLGFALWRGTDAAHLNLDGTRNLLAGQPARVVFASSAAVYGAWPDNPLPMGEDQWPRPNRECRYGSQKLTAERICGETVPTISLRIGAVLGRHADPKVAKAVRGYRLAVPAFRGEKEAVQFLAEDDAAAALHVAGACGVDGVVNIAPDDWLTADDIARVAGSRVVRLPRRVLIAGSEAGFRLGLVPFGADRAILLNGPLALDPSLAARVLGWRPSLGSAQVLTDALA
ncbi:MAG: NAD-dependent epimerase/dehydratase family protein [Actinomycetota bacterium]|nr:NAD-dependent epimerase/dehydratase family protein [Actinomycetota bacterium]